MSAPETCAYTVHDLDGEGQPCDRPATGWRWYQGHAHEDSLDVACDLHENEGGRRLHAAETAVARVAALVDQWDGEVGAQEDYQHGAAVRAVEACIRDVVAALRTCECPPCPGRGNDGHGLSHCAECCFGSGVIADEDCPVHGRAALTKAKP